MKVVRWLHRWGGGLIGLFLLLIGLSGAILVHRHAWIDAGLPQSARSAPVNAIVEQLASNPELAPRFIVLPQEDFAYFRVLGPGESGAYVTTGGEIAARWSSKWDRPELWLFDLHTHLLIGDTGSTLSGLFAVAGLIFVGTGLWLWWPTRRKFEWRLWPRKSKRAAIIHHHRDLGVVLAPLLTLSLLTGAAMALKPFGALLVMPLSSPAEIRASLSPPPVAGATTDGTIRWQAILSQAREAYPQAEIRILGLPQAPDKPMFVRMRQPGEWTANGRTMLWFHPQSGVLLRNDDAFRLISGMQLYFSFYPLHTGEAGGLVLKLLMTLSGIGLVLLGSLAVWTFWFRAPSRKPRRQANHPVAVAAE